ncbi:hypothetical protein ET532_000275 [Verminephrobacter sp. Larva24]|nr:hypothetical protein ET532_000275 [Verminephrobacter sp. Larva24]
MTTSLAQFAQDIASGALRVIDLTHTLSSDFPALQLPPQFGQVWAFKSERISHYDEAGPGWYWNNFSCGEHTGTHFDAPAHWITGKDHPDNTVDTMDTRNFIGPAVVVDASAEVAGNDDWLLTVDFLKAWEDRHGRIPAGAWLLSFELRDPGQCLALCNRLQLPIKATGLGDARTLIIPVAHTIFWEAGPAVRAAMGIADSMIRLSVGLEEVQDLQDDFERALSGHG